MPSSKPNTGAESTGIPPSFYQHHPESTGIPPSFYQHHPESTGIPPSFYQHHPDWDQNVLLQPGKAMTINDNDLRVGFYANSCKTSC